MTISKKTSAAPIDARLTSSNTFFAQKDISVETFAQNR